MNAAKLKEILDKHLKWLRGEAGGKRADLSRANLSRADLSDADLSRADLYGAILSRANLSGAKNICVFIACPDSGAFIGWKKARNECTGENVIVKLLIPEGAARTSATGRKCRCDRAEVVEIQDENGETIPGACATSKRDSSFRYVPGEVVSVADFDKNRWNECAPGIHFFITRDEAVAYLA